MFMGPLEATKPWNTKSVEGITRFLDRVWRLCVAEDGALAVTAGEPPLEARRALHEPFVLVLAPFAPHLAEELWQRLGHPQSLAHEPWPAYDPELVVEDVV